MTAKHSLPRRRRNLLAADPHCHWCGHEVREYTIQFRKGDVIPGDMATVDHLIQKSEGKPRTPGATVLACHPCNQWRSRENIRVRELLPCAECGIRLTASGFCCGECWTANRTRLGVHLLPQKLHKAEKIRRRKREKKRRYRQRRAAKRLAPEAVLPGEVLLAQDAEVPPGAAG